MKKVFILFLLLISSFCTILPSSSGPVDPTILDPFSGLLFGEYSRLSYIFFSKDQQVLIENKNISENKFESENKSVNSYYKLLSGELYRSNVITYKLEGWGSYDGYYIGILMRKTTLGTELGITVQNSRTLAINAARALATSTSIKEVALGKPLQSSALYTFSALNPIVKTSVAGIFKPNDNQFFSITDLTPTNNVHAIYKKNTKKTDGSFDSEEYELTFETNISDSTTIYKYFDSVNGFEFLIGIKFDFNDEFPRLQIIENKRSNNPLFSDIANLAFELSTVIAWEYSFFDSLRVLDNSLIPFFKNTFVEFYSINELKYDPLNTSLWFFNEYEDSIRVTKRYENVFTEEDYLIAPTAVSGVFKLIDFRNDGVQTHSGNFFTITSEGIITDLGNVSTITIADTIDGFDNPIFKKSLKRLEDVTPFPIKVTPNLLPLIPTLGENLDGTSIKGRSGFQAYVESDTDTIHLVGGYTNRGPLPSSIPRTIGSTGDLHIVFNDVWTIKNILSGSPEYDDTTLNLVQTDDVYFQQMVGATTKKSQTRADDVFWAYGAGSIKDDKFSFNNNTPPEWNTFILSDAKFNLIFHTAMVAHNNSLYILGGTSTDSITSDARGEKYGVFQNNIVVTSTRNTVTADTWRILRSTDSAAADIWSPRVHPRVFSVGKSLVLVGGMTGGNGNTAPTAVNDVWTSENNGTNWTKVHLGGTPATSSTISGAPPIQDTINDGPLIGTEHNGIIYLLDPVTRHLFYSSNKGKNWFKSPIGFETSDNKPLYGAQLVGIKNSLILIGGQTVSTTDITTDHSMEPNMYIGKISI